MGNELQCQNCNADVNDEVPTRKVTSSKGKSERPLQDSQNPLPPVLDPATVAELSSLKLSQL